MRILFVSGVAVGGSARSTRELAERMAAKGHAVGLLLGVSGAPRRRYIHKRATNLEVKLGASSAGRAVTAAAARIARRPRTRPDRPVRVWESYLPENSFPVVFRTFRPDVVVASSIDRVAWRRVRARLAERGTPGALYIREENAYGHLTISQAPPDLFFANAHVHAEAIRKLGFTAVTVPSVVTVDDSRVESTRTRVLLVNPIAISGVDIALRLARARPDVPFVFAESWPLTSIERDDLLARLDSLPNVELRAFTPDPQVLYRDARVLLAPYLTNGRPRVVLEAQANAIPVLASNLPALSEAVGPGGRIVDPDAPIDDWVAALADLSDDENRYARFSAAARDHALRDEVQPDVIASRFEAALTDLVDRGRARPTGSEA